MGGEHSRGGQSPGEQRPLSLRKLRLKRTDSRREESFEVGEAILEGEFVICSPGELGSRVSALKGTP